MEAVSLENSNSASHSMIENFLNTHTPPPFKWDDAISMNETTSSNSHLAL